MSEFTSLVEGEHPLLFLIMEKEEYFEAVHQLFKRIVSDIFPELDQQIPFSSPETPMKTQMQVVTEPPITLTQDFPQRQVRQIPTIVQRAGDLYTVAWAQEPVEISSQTPDFLYAMLSQATVLYRQHEDLIDGLIATLRNQEPRYDLALALEGLWAIAHVYLMCDLASVSTIEGTVQLFKVKNLLWSLFGKFHIEGFREALADKPPFYRALFVDVTLLSFMDQDDSIYAEESSQDCEWILDGHLFSKSLGQRVRGLHQTEKKNIQSVMLSPLVRQAYADFLRNFDSEIDMREYEEIVRSQIENVLCMPINNLVHSYGITLSSGHILINDTSKSKSNLEIGKKVVIFMHEMAHRIRRTRATTFGKYIDFATPTKTTVHRQREGKLFAYFPIERLGEAGDELETILFGARVKGIAEASVHVLYSIHSFRTREDFQKAFAEANFEEVSEGDRVVKKVPKNLKKRSSLIHSRCVLGRRTSKRS